MTCDPSVPARFCMEKYLMIQEEPLCQMLYIPSQAGVCGVSRPIFNISRSFLILYTLESYSQVQVVQLEADRQEDKDAECLAELPVRPVICGMCPAEPGDHDRGPGPPCALEDDNQCEAEADSPLQGHAGSVDPVLPGVENVSWEKAMYLGI